MRVSDEDLYVVRVNDDLRVSAPRAHFLAGRPLIRLHDGDAVPFDFQLTLFDGNRDLPLRRTVDRFVVSYDLWDENFKVTRMGGAHRSGLSANAAERWCLDNLLVSAAGIPPSDRLWLRLEIRAQDPPDVAAGTGGGDPGISLKSLVELFGRPPRTSPHWTLDSTSFRLEDLDR
jgi:hypothetical protein